TPATAYPLSVRAINTVGAGGATATTFTTRPAAVTAPSAAAGTSSTTVSWPQSASATVTGYTVYAHPGPATCATTSISDAPCVTGAPAGTAYPSPVVAHSPSGDSAASPPPTPVPPTPPVVPATAPTNAPTTLSTTDGVLASVEPAQQITLVGTG